jgi:thiol-disulfide isomerase/thioredoxin
MYASYGDLGNKEQPNRDVMNVLELANVDHKRQLIQNNRVVVVDIYADWCGPCKQTAPDYATIATEYTRPGECAIVKYNYDKLDPSERSRIHGIPVFQFFVEGKQVDEVVGADIDAVKVKLRDILQSTNNRQRVMAVNSQNNPNNYAPNNYNTQGGDGQNGPNYNRNSIRNTRNGIPQTSGEYIPNNNNTSGGNYHQTNW